MLYFRMNWHFPPQFKPLQRAFNFIKDSREKGLPDDARADLSKFDPETLNEMQRVLYNMVTEHVDGLMSPNEKEKPDQMLMIVQG